MVTITSGNSLESAAGNSWQHLGDIGDNQQALRLRIRARGLRGSRGRMRARVMSKRLPVSPVSPVFRTRVSCASNMTFITLEHGVRSQTPGACGWTIDMTQSAFLQANAGFTPHLVEKAGAVAPKTLEQGISNGLFREDIENSGNGR